MRNVLPGFYAPSRKQIERIWQEGTLALDANVLLGLYRYTPKTRDLLIQLLQSFADRLWMPYQVALEYQRRRQEVIADQKRAYAAAISTVDKVVDLVGKEMKRYEAERHPYIEPKRLAAEFRKAADKAKASLKRLEKKHPDYTLRGSSPESPVNAAT